MLVKFKATNLEVFGAPSDVYPYYEFYANVMDKTVVGVTKILEIARADAADYKLIEMDGKLVDRAKELWPIRLENKDYTELNPSIV